MLYLICPVETPVVLLCFCEHNKKDLKPSWNIEQVIAFAVKMYFILMYFHFATNWRFFSVLFRVHQESDTHINPKQ